MVKATATYPHAENPAARKLEARWRLAQSPASKGKDAAWLDAREARTTAACAPSPWLGCTTACALHRPRMWPPPLCRCALACHSRLSFGPPQPLILTHEEMENLGGTDAGYEQLRFPAPHPTDFKYSFELNTHEHVAWLEAQGTI